MKQLRQLRLNLLSATTVLMNHLRIIVFSVMVVLIGTSIFVLSTNKVESKFSGGVGSSPTAYIEASQFNASFKVGGRISEILVKEGDVVKKGQVLARIEGEELLNKVAQAEAAVKVQEGKLAEAKSVVLIAEGKVGEAQASTEAAIAKKTQGHSAVDLTANSVEKQVKEARAVVKVAEAQLQAVQNGARAEEKKQAESKLEASRKADEIAKANLERFQAMYDEGLTSKAALDEAEMSYKKANTEYEVAEQAYKMVMSGPRQEEVNAAKAQVEQAKAVLELAESGRGKVAVQQGDILVAEAGLKQSEATIKSAQSGIAQAEALVSSAAAGLLQAEAALAEAETYVSYMELTAAVDGVIVSKSAEDGELVGSGYPVLTIESHANNWTTFYFAETDVVNLAVGKEIDVTLIATGEQVKGEIVQIEPAASFAIRKASQSVGDTDIRSFGVKVVLSDLPEGIISGMTVRWDELEVSKDE